MLHRQDDDEDDKRQAQVLGGTEISRAVAAAERVDACLLYTSVSIMAWLKAFV